MKPMKPGNMLEIRWHGRGGQGAKTAADFIASCSIKEGKYSQGFPDYGPERMGAPSTGGLPGFPRSLSGFIAR